MRWHHPYRRGQEEAATLTLNPNPKGDGYSGAFTPRGTGRYRAETKLPNGKPATARFMVFREQLERTETAADIAYLKHLSRASGGGLIDPDGIKDLVSTLLRESTPMEPRTRLHALWDTPKILLLLTFLLAFEWYLRRRWGLS